MTYDELKKEALAQVEVCCEHGLACAKVEHQNIFGSTVYRICADCVRELRGELRVGGPVGPVVGWRTMQPFPDKDVVIRASMAAHTEMLLHEIE